jgi:hypothetical protein
VHAKPQHFQRQPVLHHPRDWTPDNCHADESLSVRRSDRKLVADRRLVVSMEGSDKTLRLCQRHRDNRDH